jgi:hypothetical protein
MQVKFYFGKPKGRDPLGKLGVDRDNINPNVKDTGYEIMTRILLAQDSFFVKNICEHNNELSGSINGSVH